MNKLDAIQLAIAADREKRDAELRDAFRNPDAGALWDLIRRDSAELIASMYAAPAEKDNRQRWIRDQLHSNPAFVAKVSAAADLVFDYALSVVRLSADAWNGCGKDMATAPSESAESYEASAALIAARRGDSR